MTNVSFPLFTGEGRRGETLEGENKTRCEVAEISSETAKIINHNNTFHANAAKIFYFDFIVIVQNVTM